MPDLKLEKIDAKIQLPDGGGGYRDYLSNIEDMIDYRPYESLVDSKRKDVEDLLKNKNDPRAWLAYSGSAIMDAWMALPSDIRKYALDAIFDIIEDALNEISDVVGDIVNAVSSTIAEAVPIIGAIVKAIIEIIMAAREVVKKIKQTNEGYSLVELDEARTDTIAKYQDPNDWILRQVKVDNYLRYAGIRGLGLGDWDLKPCFGRSSEESWLIFNELPGQSDEGKCSGVPYKCDLDMDCEPKPKSGEDDECIRYLGVSALYYPYWSPSYGAVPIRREEIDSRGLVFNYSYPKHDMNSLLITRQIALLTIPAVNLQVDGEMVQRFADRFKLYWDRTYKQVHETLVRIDKDGYAIETPSNERLAIDSKFDAEATQSKKNTRKFYYDDDGLIRPYVWSGADVSEWGIRAKGGRHGDKYVGISVGQYNAVIGNTLAFFSARANFLRNGYAMAGMLDDYENQGGTDAFWPDVREAIQYAADYGKMLPTSTVVLQEPDKPARVKKSRYSEDEFTLVAKKIDATSGSKSSLPLLLIGGGLIALLALKGKR